MKKHKGYTIGEIMVSISIFVFVTTLALALFQGANFNYKTSSLQAEVEKSAQETLPWMTQDIQESSFNGIDTSVPNAITIVSARNVSFQRDTVTGQPMWNRWVKYTINGTVLTRTELPFSPSTTIPSFPTDWTGSTTRGISRNLKILTFTTGPNNSILITIGTNQWYRGNETYFTPEVMQVQPKN